ncbi:MAG TPA: hypothetical protein VLC51_01170 [Nitrospira sp.]|nr:hypothetical protein [Nitrospira sp.]
MIVVRHDCVGKAEMKLIKRPTNTCAWVDNWSFYAASNDGALAIPVVRFFGTDPIRAERLYNEAVLEAHRISEAL